MTYEATLIYSEPLLRKAVFGFWRRSVGAGFIVVIVIFAILLAFRAVRGDTSWMVGVLGSVLAIAIAMAVAVYVVHYRNAIGKFREMGDPKATFCAEQSCFTVTSSIGTSTFRWSTIKEVWQFPEVWLLLFSKAQFVTLPIACLPPEMQSFIVQQVRSSGGRIS